ncbi:hypothetical protein ElyMa_003615200 [Elysia marginata]|uniref:Uncharacterized protein n=1 Tax=Elysia marginata TaxID=1093978 RepID=A0AAV4EUF1_9GAST|nr:hypothetical protein ElyMa_003615200 [Elysia marginata]
MKYYGHLRRHDSIQKRIPEGKIDRRRGRGRRRQTWLGNIQRTSQIKMCEVCETVLDRRRWRTVTAHLGDGVAPSYRTHPKIRLVIRARGPSQAFRVEHCPVAIEIDPMTHPIPPASVAFSGTVSSSPVVVISVLGRKLPSVVIGEAIVRALLAQCPRMIAQSETVADKQYEKKPGVDLR